MTHFTVIRQQERERREWRAAELERNRLAAEQAAREQQRIASLQNQWAQITSARANAVLAGYQQRAYGESVQRLFSIARLISD
jgi:hypothetical protein